MKTTDAGYINQNNQKNLGYRGVSETHYNQKFFEMECLDCGHKYMANGCDVWLRKCPVCGVRKPKNTVSHTQTKRSTRVISDKLRYQVLKRDHFKCCACGASPAKRSTSFFISLHITSIVSSLYFSRIECRRSSP